MNAKTMKQFANWTLELSNDIHVASGATVRSRNGTLSERLGKLARWALEQAEKRDALEMSIDDFMARCPASVRDAALALVREAKAELKALRAAAAQAAQVKAAPAKKAVLKRKAVPEKERADLMSAEDYAERLRRMDLFEAARIQREE